jgi:hypothetical protein
VVEENPYGDYKKEKRHPCGVSGISRGGGGSEGREGAPKRRLLRKKAMSSALSRGRSKRATWYVASRYRGIKARISGEYRAMALAAVKGVYSTGSLAERILRLFSLDFPSAR